MIYPVDSAIQRLNNRGQPNFFLVFSFVSTRVARPCSRPNPVWQPDDTACLLAGVFVINVYLQKGPLAAIFVSWMKVGSVNQLNILFY